MSGATYFDWAAALLILAYEADPESTESNLSRRIMALNLEMASLSHSVEKSVVRVAYVESSVDLPTPSCRLAANSFLYPH
jgi:hypothetical protein